VGVFEWLFVRRLVAAWWWERCLRRWLIYHVLNRVGWRLTTMSAFDVGSRTRRLVIGEILTAGGSHNERDVGPGPVSHLVGATGGARSCVLSEQRSLLTVVGGLRRFGRFWWL
jgi:hypothetical protein